MIEVLFTSVLVLSFLTGWFGRPYYGEVRVAMKIFERLRTVQGCVVWGTDVAFDIPVSVGDLDWSVNQPNAPAVAPRGYMENAGNLRDWPNTELSTAAMAKHFKGETAVWTHEPQNATDPHYCSLVFKALDGVEALTFSFDLRPVYTQMERKMLSRHSARAMALLCPTGEQHVQ